MWPAPPALRNVRRHGCRLVHLSSDLVYSGKGTGMYREGGSGGSVRSTERHGASRMELTRDLPARRILRISLPMGPVQSHAGAIDWIDSPLSQDAPATLYFDEVRSCTLTDISIPCSSASSPATSVAAFTGRPRSHDALPNRSDRNRTGALSPRVAARLSPPGSRPMPPRAGNVSMCSDSSSGCLEGSIPGLAAGSELMPDHRQWHASRRSGEEGSHTESGGSSTDLDYLLAASLRRGGQTITPRSELIRLHLPLPWLLARLTRSQRRGRGRPSRRILPYARNKQCAIAEPWLLPETLAVRPRRWLGLTILTGPHAEPCVLPG